ncbi:protein TolA [uncultured Mediterranean phage]|nr:protein TolA [uncultured Mediterranean phage]
MTSLEDRQWSMPQAQAAMAAYQRARGRQAELVRRQSRLLPLRRGRAAGADGAAPRAERRERRPAPAVERQHGDTRLRSLTQYFVLRPEPDDARIARLEQAQRAIAKPDARKRILFIKGSPLPRDVPRPEAQRTPLLFIIIVDGDTTILRLKNLMFEGDGSTGVLRNGTIPTEYMRLIYAGKELLNEKTVSELPLSNESTIHFLNIMPVRGTSAAYWTAISQQHTAAAGGAAHGGRRKRTKRRRKQRKTRRKRVHKRRRRKRRTRRRTRG